MKIGDIINHALSFAGLKFLSKLDWLIKQCPNFSTNNINQQMINLVYHNNCTPIYRLLSYPLRSLRITENNNV